MRVGTVFAFALTLMGTVAWAEVEFSLRLNAEEIFNDLAPFDVFWEQHPEVLAVCEGGPRQFEFGSIGSGYAGWQTGGPAGNYDAWLATVIEEQNGIRYFGADYGSNSRLAFASEDQFSLCLNRPLEG